MNRHAAAVSEGVRGGRASTRFDRLVLWLAALAVLVTAASALARAGWAFELITHFRFQMAAGALLLCGCALVRRRLATATLAAAAVAVNGIPLLPYVLDAGVGTAVAGGGIRLMAANVHYSNTDYAALIEQVRETDPDVLGLLEVDGEWLDAVAALDAEFEWSIRYPQEGPWGLALYSKLPITELPESPYVAAGRTTAILVELEHGDEPVELVLAHVSAPSTPARARLRNVQLARLARLLRPEANRPRILMGDLNITPWSPYYADLVAQASLRNAARGFGYLPTWPAGINPLKIPIDHCLVSDELGVVSFRTGSAFGSDHLPIVVEVTGVEAKEAAE